MPKSSNTLNCAVAFACGALAMYYLDSRHGARRRALLRDQVAAAARDAAGFMQGEGKRAADVVKGVVATRHLDRRSHSPPQSDAQLVERIRSRLGRFVSRPRAVCVEARDGHVRLSGDLLERELARLLQEVSAVAGTRDVVNALDLHPTLKEFDAALASRHRAEPTEESVQLTH